MIRITMKNIVNIIILTILISCASSKSTELKSNKTISKVFNKSEVKDLQIIFDFFNAQICDSKKMNKDLLNECYEKYCSEIKEQQETEYEFRSKVNFKEQLEMYEKINKSTFNTIWHFQKSLPIRERKDTLKYLGLSYTGKYKDFLHIYGKENKAVLEYSESFNASGDLSLIMMMGLLMNYDYYDISDIRTKLIIAIQYLTLNDQNSRIEKY